MKTFPIFFLSIMMVCACGDDNFQPGTAALDEATYSYEKSQLAEMLDKGRGDVINALKAGQGDDPDVTELIPLVNTMFDNVKAKITKYGATSVEDLKAFTLKEYSAEFTVLGAKIKEQMTKKLPARVGREPLPGERVRLADDDGICSNAAQIDFGQFSIQAVDLMVTSVRIASTQADPRTHLKAPLNGMADRCDMLVERYGEKDSCKYLDPKKQPIRMPAIVRSCTKIREQARNL